MMMHHFASCCKDLKTEIKNHGEKLVITIHGEKEKISKVEKKLKAFKTLCCEEEDMSCCA